ncbi:erythronate-4-phosphate dehydrogenase [Legionella quinlivanii]|uniref:Erythronate-4-phosphate dehydrogenase n=1 Tax=Legionella quinlivanii TaxID=45073 RepID=A0A0W0Y2A7_9GAMM|nr:NAD(P)-dependent oxidoreductase [Legionella quinlivanii]KTD50686.1 erythronate-4-phosphate dehydrogenase [Legionella quinlivanii]SEG36245.1 erythronate-4-phosphate dehydrogenase [Legionella quinlivanii DSM 21216]STY11627.1 erythronate-4-phosphate dehydrogenase [Legionella quinlivanii]
MNILADASLPNLKSAFPAPFNLTVYEDQSHIPHLLAGQEILLCRAALKVNESLFRKHRVKYVATASSGTDHIDSGLLAQLGIELLDAKGCNAQAVADYVVCSIAWLRKHRKFSGKNAVVIGAGMVGSKVSRRLKMLGFEVLNYDPLKSASDTGFKSCGYQELFDADLISIHANLHTIDPYPSFHLLDEPFFNAFNPQGIIINAARGHIVNEQSLLKRPGLIYCTDVYSNEPAVNPEIIKMATVCTPHIAGHSIEAKLRAVQILSCKLHALYNLPLSPFPESQVFMDEPAAETWEELALALYNPEPETAALKQAVDLQTAFLQLRKAHPPRHDFDHYQMATGKLAELQRIAGVGNE